MQADDLTERSPKPRGELHHRAQGGIAAASFGAADEVGREGRLRAERLEREPLRVAKAFGRSALGIAADPLGLALLPTDRAADVGRHIIHRVAQSLEHLVVLLGREDHALPSLVSGEVRAFYITRKARPGAGRGKEEFLKDLENMVPG
jgi:hypothetical protein